MTSLESREISARHSPVPDLRANRKEPNYFLLAEQVGRLLTPDDSGIFQRDGAIQNDPRRNWLQKAGAHMGV